MQDTPFTPEQVAAWFKRHKKGKVYPAPDACREIAEVLEGHRLILYPPKPRPEPLAQSPPNVPALQILSVDSKTEEAKQFDVVVQKASALREEISRLIRLSQRNPPPHGLVGMHRATEVWRLTGVVDRALFDLTVSFPKRLPGRRRDQTPRLAFNLAQLAAKALLETGADSASLKERDGPVAAFVAVALAELFDEKYTMAAVATMVGRHIRRATPAD